MILMTALLESIYKTYKMLTVLLEYIYTDEAICFRLIYYSVFIINDKVALEIVSLILYCS